MFLNHKYATFMLVIVFYCGCAEKPLSTKPFAVKTEFENEGQRQDYEAEQLFNQNYKVEYYKKYNGPVVLNGNNYEYKDVVVSVEPVRELRAIFNKGIFYPEVMAESFKYQQKSKVNKDSLIAWHGKDISEVKYLIPKVDSVWITNFNEMKFLEASPKQKRFKFWLFRKGFANPTIYFMELTNRKATSKTGLLSFIDGAKLTFFQQGWVVI
jgi:hypothetical protein